MKGLFSCHELIPESSLVRAYTWTSQHIFEASISSANRQPVILPGDIIYPSKDAGLAHPAERYSTFLYSKHVRMQVNRYHTDGPSTITSISASYSQGSHFDILQISLNEVLFVAPFSSFTMTSHLVTHSCLSYPVLAAVDPRTHAAQSLKRDLHNRQS